MKIVIVGGGTAGWLAAYIISKSQPSLHHITVIESSEIGIIGAGEGVTGLFTDVLNGRYFDSTINIDDFLSYCDATNKIGIKFVNWKGQNESFFSPLDGSPTGTLINDYVFKYVLSKFGNYKAHLASRLGLDFEIGRNYDKINALHFNAHKVGKFFKNICLTDNINSIDAKVIDIKLNPITGFVKSLSLDNQTNIDADFFIDCSGFNRILMKKLDVGWISYKDYLPLNSAMPFLIDGFVKRPYTTATAMSSGWIWDIPLQNRRGCGYVYNDNFLTKQQAQDEVERLVGHEISPIKFIQFDPGRAESFWKKNVLSLGLASCFVEPLQATSIHTTISQILIFVNDYLTGNINGTVSNHNEKSYNLHCGKFYDLNLDFVSMHYQGGRSDSDFWRYVKEQAIVSPYASEIITRSKNKIIGYTETTNTFGAPAMGLWNWSLAGLGLIDPNLAYKDLNDTKLYDIAENHYINFIANSS